MSGFSVTCNPGRGLAANNRKKCGEVFIFTAFTTVTAFPKKIYPKTSTREVFQQKIYIEQFPFFPAIRIRLTTYIDAGFNDQF